MRAAIVLVLLLWGLLLLAWLTLHWGILPRIDQWRPQIEQRASAALGVPVRIGQIQVQSSGWVPALLLNQVVLLDRQGREALRLPRVSAAVSPVTLLSLRLTFAQLHIEGAQLDVRRDAKGRIQVAGLDLSGPSPGSTDREGEAADWVFQQRELVIRHAQLRWTDELRQAPPLLLSDADLVLRNGLRDHDLRIDATPPAGWGERLSLQGRFSQPLLAQPGEWRRWSGTLHANLPRVDVGSLRRHVDLPFDLQAGDGALRLWLDLRQGEWQQATLDLALDQVQLQLNRQLQPLDLRQVHARLGAERGRHGLRFSAEGLRFQVDGQPAWEPSRMALSWQYGPSAGPGLAAPVASGQFSADRLDLATMAGIAGRLPLPEPVRRTLAEMAPEGQVRELEWAWTGPPDQPDTYRARAQGRGLTLAAKPAEEAGKVGRPGWRQADLSLQATERGGEARLAMRDGALEFPGVFAEPVVPLQTFEARLAWQIQAKAGGLPDIALQVEDARFTNADAQGEFKARWTTGPGEGFGVDRRYPGRLELSGLVREGQANRVARYLPLGVGEHARDYVARAVRAGRVRDGQFRVRGDLWQFPYAHGANGDFQIRARAEDVELAYVPPVLAPDGRVLEAGWPAFTQVQGELVFDRTRMDIRQARAQLWGLTLSQVQGGISNLVEHPTLAITGQAKGPLADLLRLVHQTPLNTWTRQALADAQGNGPADLVLGMSVPLEALDKSTVKGSVGLAGNELRLRSDVPVLTATRGRIEFSHTGFTLAGVRARALGGELALDGGSLDDGDFRVVAQGLATAEGLRRAPELGAVLRLAQPASGQAPYRVQVSAPKGLLDVQVSSPLTGLALDLPPPLRKSADTSWPVKVQLSQLPDGPAGQPRDLLKVDWGSVLQAEYWREGLRNGAGQADWQVSRGALALGGEPLPQVPSGTVVAAARLGLLDVDAWGPALDRLLATPGSGGTAGGSAATGAAGEGLGAGYLPGEVQIKAQAVLLGGRRWTGVNGSLQRRTVSGGDANWRASLRADQTEGQVQYQPASGAAPARVQARLSRLVLPPEEATIGPSPTVASGEATRAPNPPALDVVVDDFELAGKRLGRLELDAEPRGSPERREWRLSRISLGQNDARLSGSGQWSAASRRMTLDFRVDIGDSGALVERLGMGRTVRGGKGRMQGQLHWSGSPLEPEWSKLTGQMQMNLEGGQFLKAEPGAARLLGILSLQSLPRRLTLDFRDVFQQGFSFDSVTGDVSLKEGVARTNNLRIRGVQAVVLVEGQTDLRRETQDLRMVVVPEINAGTASLAYAAINPAVGLGTFLAQYVLRRPLQQAGTREFSIGGTWDQPAVEVVERKLNAPLPADLEAPAPSAAASTPAGQNP